MGAGTLSQSEPILARKGAGSEERPQQVEHFRALRPSYFLAKDRRRGRVEGCVFDTPLPTDFPDPPLVCLMVIPVSLGTQSSFRRLYDEPIVRGQQPDASSEEKLLGQFRAAEVINSYQPLFSPYNIIYLEATRT